MSGEVSVSTERVRLRGGILGFHFFSLTKNKFGTTIWMRFEETSSGIGGCYSEYEGKMEIKLTDGEIIELTQFSDTECGDVGYVGYVALTREQTKMSKDIASEIMEENMDKLCSQPWTLMRIHKTEFYHDYPPVSYRKLREPEKLFIDAYKAVNEAYKIAMSDSE
jgi:hypothetical protein